MKKKILIIAGGTGGHIFPALSVADSLQQRDISVNWLGSKIGLEQTLVPDHYPMTYISAKRLRGKGLKTYLTAPGRLLLTIWQAWRAIIKLNPDLVLAMGGFVSGPGGLAAKLAGKKLIIHEQNAVAGYSNRLLSYCADVVMTAYPNVFPERCSPKVIGNPVRQSIVDAAREKIQREATPKLRIFVLGGSQGAHGLNEIILNFVQNFSDNHRLEWWHQTGKNDYKAVSEKYNALNITAHVEPFIDDIVEPYRWADLIICRAGALTVAEITCMGLPSILVPFPAAVDDHQWKNSLYLKNAKAAFLVREKELTPQHLTQLIVSFLEKRNLLTEMSENARQLAKPDAADSAVKIILQNLNNQEEKK